MINSNEASKSPTLLPESDRRPKLLSVTTSSSDNSSRILVEENSLADNVHLLEKLLANANENDGLTNISAFDIESLIKGIKKVKYKSRQEDGKNIILQSMKGTPTHSSATVDFLLNTYAPKKKMSSPSMSSSPNTMSNRFLMAARKASLINTFTRRSSLEKKEQPTVLRRESTEKLLDIHGGIDVILKSVIIDKLERLNEWDFDTLSFFNIVSEPLVVIGLGLFLRRDFISFFSLEEKKVIHFLSQISQKYKAPNNAYHNDLHGADVAQSVHYMLSPTCFSECGNIELHYILAAIIAGIIHDVAHPGYNNAFLVLTKHKQAIRYNDKSPLENMHVAKGYKVLNNPESNFLEVISKETQAIIRMVIIEMVLATDNGMHAKHLGELNYKLENPAKNFDFSEQVNLVFFLQIALHAADISNPAKPLLIYEKWTERIMKEFYNQGDKELELKIPVTAIFDRRKPIPTAKFQTGFIVGLVLPLYQSFSKIPGFNLELPMKCISDNLDHWKKEIDAMASVPVHVKNDDEMSDKEFDRKFLENRRESLDSLGSETLIEDDFAINSPRGREGLASIEETDLEK